MWGTKHTHKCAKFEWDSPKVTVFCASSHRKLYGSFFFVESTVTRYSYLDTFQPLECVSRYTTVPRVLRVDRGQTVAGIAPELAMLVTSTDYCQITKLHCGGIHRRGKNPLQNDICRRLGSHAIKNKVFRDSLYTLYVMSLFIHCTS